MTIVKVEIKVMYYYWPHYSVLVVVVLPSSLRLCNTSPGVTTNHSKYKHKHTARTTTARRINTSSLTSMIVRTSMNAGGNTGSDDASVASLLVDAGPTMTEKSILQHFQAATMTGPLQ